LSSNTKPAAGNLDKTALLSRALGDSERVQGKVEQAGVGLSSVNAVLKAEVAEAAPPPEVERALSQSEDIELKVQEAATELATVNSALAQEVDERHHLEDQLTVANAALAESRAEEKKSRANALHDAVTGLPNLTLFHDRLVAALAQAERHAWKLAVMFLDLDQFKLVNDTYGHDIGDRVLSTVAQRLLSSVRRSDTVCRRSGDEFLILLLEANDEAGIVTLAAKIGESIAKPCDFEGVELSVHASIGIALYPEDGHSVPELLKHADVAMYAAKEHKLGPVLFRNSDRPLKLS
jgi:diguanylate cyclase (GGDEF)-like protein